MTPEPQGSPFGRSQRSEGPMTPTLGAHTSQDEVNLNARERGAASVPPTGGEMLVLGGAQLSWASRVPRRTAHGVAEKRGLPPRFCALHANEGRKTRLRCISMWIADYGDCTRSPELGA